MDLCATMDKRLALLIDDYLASVFAAVKLCEESGIPRPCSNTEWAENGIPQTGILLGGVKYFKHGYGCAVHLQNGGVDFDFGEKGQIDGFNIGRLTGLAGERLRQYGFESEEALRHCFNESIEKGQLVYSGYLLYYRNPN